MRYAFWISIAIAALSCLRWFTSDDSGIYSSLRGGSDPAGNALSAGMAFFFDLFTLLGSMLTACIFLLGARLNPGLLKTVTLAFGWLVFVPVGLVALLTLLDTPAVVGRIVQARREREGLVQLESKVAYEQFLGASKLKRRLYEESEVGARVRSVLGAVLAHAPPEKRDQVGELLMGLQPRVHWRDSERINGYPRDLMAALEGLTRHAEPEVSRRAQGLVHALRAREAEYCRRVSSAPCPGS